MLNKKIKVFVLFNGYVRNLKDVALELDLFQSVTLKVVELGINECGKLYRRLIIKKIPRRNGWTLQLKFDNQINTMAHNTVRRDNFLKGLTGLNANNKNINNRLAMLEQQGNIFGKVEILNGKTYLALCNEKDGTAQLLPIK